MDPAKHTHESLFEGAVFLIDKPLNWTSFDVVNKIKYLLKHKCGIKKIKIGHAGTLDPLATGLLIVCIGKETKSIEKYQAYEKEYSGSFFLGATTPSFDLETKVDKTFPIEHISHELITKAAESFTGEQDQLPPIFSAKKIDGKRAYDLARKGKDPKVKPKKIQIHQFTIVDVSLPQVTFNIVCSKGTYIRSIARDLGEKLNSGAYLQSLRRDRIGPFDVKDALTLENFEKIISANKSLCTD